ARRTAAWSQILTPYHAVSWIGLRQIARKACLVAVRRLLWRHRHMTAPTHPEDGTPGSGDGWEIQLEVEPRAPAGTGLDLERRAHGLDEPATDREAEATAGEGVPRGGPCAAERLVQAADDLGGDPAPRVADGELHARGPALAGDDFDEPL